MEEPRTEPRRRDADATRARIRDVAKPLFAQRGYRGTRVRDVAHAAGVSPNLIARYFGGKGGLFIASSQIELAMDEVYEGPLDAFGARLARSVVGRWTGQVGDDPLLLLQRAAGEQPEAAAALATFLDAGSRARTEQYLLASGMAPDAAAVRAEAVDSLILGLSMRRRILTADLGDVTELERWLAEALQRVVGD